MQLGAGDKIGAFQVIGLLGAGAMGEVYRARDLKLGREVAIKVVRQPESATENMLARFQREAQILAALNHPNIAGIYGLEEHDGSTFLVMELAPGPTLSERLVRGPLPPREMLLRRREERPEHLELAAQADAVEQAADDPAAGQPDGEAATGLLREQQRQRDPDRTAHACDRDPLHGAAITGRRPTSLRTRW